MMRLAGGIGSILALFVMASTGWAQNAPASSRFSVLKAMQIAGHNLFNEHCASCHAGRAGTRNVLGPNLAGVVGRPAASLADFPYSDALKKSGLVWTEDNLRKWIADSATLVPNTLMPHVSISDPAEQLYLIAYLKTLKAPAAR